MFSDSVHSDDNIYLTVECKKKTRKDGRSQLEDYLRLSKSVLGVWFNGDETLYIRKYEKNGTVKFIDIPNIPLYGQRVEDVGLFKRNDLKRTHNLKSVFNSMRNYLAANNTGITLDNEFVSQIINLIFCKIYDERFFASAPYDVSACMMRVILYISMFLHGGLRIMPFLCHDVDGGGA